MTFKPRDMGEVVDRMVAVLGSHAPELRARLLSISGSAGYTPPEHMRDRWLQLCEAFNDWARAKWGCAPEQWPEWYVAAGRILAGQA